MQIWDAKYLFIIDSLGAGGAERSLLNLLRDVQDRGIKPILVTLKPADVGFEDEARHASYSFQVINGSGFQRVLSLRRIILDLRPDLIYTCLFGADIIGRMAAIGTGVPVVSGLVNTTYDRARLSDPAVIGWRFSLVRFIDGWTSRHLTNHFHAISVAVKESAIRHLGIEDEKITVIHRGRDVAFLGEPSSVRRHRVRAREAIPEQAFLFITVGRQEYQKGHTVLIKAFAEVARTDTRSLLLIAGRPGHSTSEIGALVDRLGLRDRVRLLGHRLDVPDLLACSDVFVFPSRYEGLGGAVIEAMALGLPVIMSDLPALNELVSEQGSLRSPPGDVGALARAMRAMRESDTLHQLGSINRNRFLHHFQSQLANERLLGLLADVARGSRR